MKTMLALLAAGLLVAADKPADEAAQKERKKLAGVWQAEKSVQDGQEQPDAADHVLTFEGNSFAITRKGNVFVKGTFKVNPAKKPKEIDMEVQESPNGKQDGKTAKGIYELEGDQLKWCTAHPDKDSRPTEFASQPGSQRLFITFKREKK
jgi:uncharacterized protein (TIGR03067 family)